MNNFYHRPLNSWINTPSIVQNKDITPHSTPGFTTLLHSVTLLLLLVSCPLTPPQFLIAPVSFLTMLTLRVSVLFTLTLTLIRTINIVSPFTPLNTPRILLFMISFPLIFWCPVIAHQMINILPTAHYDLVFTAIVSSSRVGDSLVRVVAGQDSHHLSILLCLTLPFVLPSLIALVSMGIQLRCLLKPALVGDGHAQSEKKRAAVSIFLLTLTFSLCTTAASVFWMFVCYNRVDLEHHVIWIYVTSVTIPFLNSAINPTILIVRGRKLKARLMSLLKPRLDTIFSMTANTAL